MSGRRRHSRRLAAGSLAVLWAAAGVLLGGPSMAAGTRYVHRPSDAAGFEVSPTDNTLPVPPIPPPTPQAYSAAPVPGEATPVPEAQATGAHISPELFNPKFYDEGDGYLAHSTMHTEQDRRVPPAGLQLSMPLQ